MHPNRVLREEEERRNKKEEEFPETEQHIYPPKTKEIQMEEEPQRIVIAIGIDQEET